MLWFSTSKQGKLRLSWNKNKPKLLMLLIKTRVKMKTSRLKKKVSLRVILRIMENWEANKSRHLTKRRKPKRTRSKQRNRNDRFVWLQQMLNT